MHTIKVIKQVNIKIHERDCNLKNTDIITIVQAPKADNQDDRYFRVEIKSTYILTVLVKNTTLDLDDSKTKTFIQQSRKAQGRRHTSQLTFQLLQLKL